MMIDYAGWFIMLSVAGLSFQALLWSVVAAEWFDFELFDGSRWVALFRYFQTGGAIRFDFVATIAGATALALAGEFFLLWRLPSLIAWLPLWPRPQLTLQRFTLAPHWPRLPIRPARSERTEQIAPSEPLPEAAPAPDLPRPPEIDPQEQTLNNSPGDAAGESASIMASGDARENASENASENDRAVITRLMALVDVWRDPPADWMRDSFREEATKVSDAGWDLLQKLGASALPLLAQIEAAGLMPGAKLADLREAIGETMDQSAPPLQSAAPPDLTSGAAWLCELLDHFVPADGMAIEDLLGRALRGMTDADWASLDRFPERAGRVRVKSDMLSEALRLGAKANISAVDRSPAGSPATIIDTLLQEFGFGGQAARSSGDIDALLIAERPDLTLVLQRIDLRQGHWRLPQGCLGPWIETSDQASEPKEHDLGRALWRQLSLLRLRQTSSRRLVGLFVAHDGAFIDEGELARQMADRSGHHAEIALAWLDPRPGPLPDLRKSLTAMVAQQIPAPRQPGSAVRRVTAQP